MEYWSVENLYSSKISVFIITPLLQHSSVCEQMKKLSTIRVKSVYASILLASKPLLEYRLQ
jgi:hypothetical protein